jgi:hypothetical protein
MLKPIALAVCLVAALTVAPGAAGSIFVYEKRGNPIDGRIWGECGYQCVTSKYRAGSGNGGTNGCAYGNWLPNGTYTVRMHSDFYSGLIKGRVWYLSDYYCSNGVTRTELFVHSEETASQGQTCGSPYDERYCWDGNADYYSLGCIKVARRPVVNGYSDLGRIDNFHHGTGTGPVKHVVVRS